MLKVSLAFIAAHLTHDGHKYSNGCVASEIHDACIAHNKMVCFIKQPDNEMAVSVSNSSLLYMRCLRVTEHCEMNPLNSLSHLF